MRAICFLHAFPLNHTMWRAQMAALPSGWTAVSPDFRGFGDAPEDGADAPPRSAATLDEYVDDVVAVLETNGIGQAVFCGCSMGGYVALALLRRHPARVAGLVLADTRASADTVAARAGRLAMLEKLDREGPEAIISGTVGKLVGATTRATRPDVVESVAAMASLATGSGIGHAVARMMNRPDCADVLAAFAGPVLVIVGDEDELIPVADSEAMAALVPGSRLVVIPRAGHVSNLDAPEAFNAALNSFLTSAVRL